MILCLHSLWENLSLQKDALLKYGVDERNIFWDKTSGSKDKRVGLDKALEFLKEGDILVVWKLDRLGRSLAHLISVITDLKSKNISFVSITEGMIQLQLLVNYFFIYLEL